MKTFSDKKKMFNGVISALPTPFIKGDVDYPSLEKLVRVQIENGINGFVVNGTTAESPTLLWAEVEKIFQLVKSISGPNIPVILGTGSNSTEATISYTEKASLLGADAALVVVPYYNKPPQRGLVQHFLKVANTSKIPVILYNVPGRTITAMTTETILQLSGNENIVGIKEASGDIEFGEKLKAQVRKDFFLLSGDDLTFVPFLKIGGHGIISVMSNLLAKACSRWNALAKNENFSEAQADFNNYQELIKLMYVEANPIPLKWMLHKSGIFRSAEMRLPLATLDDKFYSSIEKQMRQLELL